MKRENEIVNLLQSEEIDVLFLTETDTKKSNVLNYKLNGFSTYLQVY